MEAVTLLSARNDATRKAARAKEAAELVASKQGLAKHPAAVTAANKLFANCEDMRTQIQTRVAKFIQNPLLDYQKTANSSTAATLFNTIHASGLLAGSPANSAPPGLKTKLEDNVFNSGRISDASAYLKDYPGLQWPDGAPAEITLIRLEIPALRPGMVVPILRFQHGVVGFDKLENPAAYYEVITDDIDGRIRLPSGRRSNPVPPVSTLHQSRHGGQMPPHRFYGYRGTHSTHGPHCRYTPQEIQPANRT